MMAMRKSNNFIVVKICCQFYSLIWPKIDAKLEQNVFNSYSNWFNYPVGSVIMVIGTISWGTKVSSLARNDCHNKWETHVVVYNRRRWSYIWIPCLSMSSRSSWVHWLQPAGGAPVLFSRCWHSGVNVPTTPAYPEVKQALWRNIFKSP